MNDHNSAAEYDDLPEELLRHSLLLFEDEDEDIAVSVPVESGPDDTPNLPEEKTDDCLSVLEESPPPTYHQQVKRELASFLQQRHTIVEKIRKQAARRNMSRDNTASPRPARRPVSAVPSRTDQRRSRIDVQPAKKTGARQISPDILRPLPILPGTRATSRSMQDPPKTICTAVDRSVTDIAQRTTRLPLLNTKHKEPMAIPFTGRCIPEKLSCERFQSIGGQDPLTSSPSPTSTSRSPLAERPKMEFCFLPGTQRPCPPAPKMPMPLELHRKKSRRPSGFSMELCDE